MRSNGRGRHKHENTAKDLSAVVTLVRNDELTSKAEDVWLADSCGPANLHSDPE